MLLPVPILYGEREGLGGQEVLTKDDGPHLRKSKLLKWT